MSFHFTLFIGPYAEWRVRLVGEEKVDLPESLYSELIEEMILCLGTRDGIPEVTIDGVRCARFRFMPREARPDAPPRTMEFYDGGGAQERDADWSWISPRAEMDWFSEAFAPELARLAAHFGEQPTMGWGVEEFW